MHRDRNDGAVFRLQQYYSRVGRGQSGAILGHLHAIEAFHGPEHMGRIDCWRAAAFDGLGSHRCGIRVLERDADADLVAGLVREDDGLARRIA